MSPNRGLGQLKSQIRIARLVNWTSVQIAVRIATLVQKPSHKFTMMKFESFELSGLKKANAKRRFF